MIISRWKTLAEAELETPYSRQWIGKLIRQGKVEGRKLRDGHRLIQLVWMPSLLAYVREMQSLGNKKHSPGRRWALLSPMRVGPRWLEASDRISLKVLNQTVDSHTVLGKQKQVAIHNIPIYHSSCWMSSLIPTVANQGEDT
jgi:hypothetical protein